MGELQKKDKAYQQTLHEADKIVADVERRYKQQIAELELQEHKLRSRIASLEENCEELRKGGSPSASGVSAADDKYMALLEKLIEAENSVLKMKDKLGDSEKEKENCLVRIGDLERALSDVKCQGGDEQGNLALRVNELVRENAQLRSDFDFHAVTRRQLADVEARNKMLESRCEELDVSERALQDTVERAMEFLRSKQEYYEAEVAAWRRRLDDVRTELDLQEAEAVKWRSEARSCGELLAAREVEVRRQREMMTSMEECHRNEVSERRQFLYFFKQATSILINVLISVFTYDFQLMM